MKIENVTDPSQVLDLALIKDHLRIDGTQDDTILAQYLAAAVETLEQDTGHMLGERTVDIKLDSWPEGDTLLLPVWPVQSITSVTYTDEDEASSTLSSSTYISSLGDVPAKLVLKNDQTWPSDILQPVDGVVVRAVVGYTGPIPARAVQVLLLTIGLWYENRESLQPTYLKEIPQGLQALTWGLRVRL